ncbi:MAG: hypothetical protein RSD95_15410 [Clostridia bacterium]
MIHQVTTIEEGVQRLFLAGERPGISFTYHRASEHELFDTLEVNGACVPVLKWRYYPKHYTMRENRKHSIISELGRLSTLKSLDFAPNSETMAQLLCRELDLAEFFLDAKIHSIMGYGNEKAANFIVHLKNDTMMSLEAFVTLPSEAIRESKHTLFTTNGMMTDLAADKVLVQELVHVFSAGKHPVSYTDHDVCLFGLSMDDQDVCYACYALIDGKEDSAAWKEQSERLRILSEAALNTLKTGKKYLAD